MFVKSSTGVFSKICAAVLSVTMITGFTVLPSSYNGSITVSAAQTSTTSQTQTNSSNYYTSSPVKIEDYGTPIPCASRNGIYFISNNKIVFYSLVSQKVTQVDKFDDSSIYEHYVCEDKLYILMSDRIQIYSLSTGKMNGSIMLNSLKQYSPSKAYSPNALCADGNGNIYLSVAFLNSDNSYDQNLVKLSPNGNIMAKLKVNNKIFYFAGFDSTNGNLYAVGYYNWLYWGYEHDTNALYVYNVNNNKISAPKGECDILSQKYFSDHPYQAELVNGKYLFVDSIMSGCKYVVNSNKYVYNSKDYEISYFDYMSGFQISSVPMLKIDSVPEKYNDSDSVEASGGGIAYLKNTNTAVAYVGNNTLEEYRLSDNKKFGTMKLSHPVYSVMNVGNDIAVIEFENSKNSYDENVVTYYLEYIKWKHSTKITLSAPSNTMQAGKTMKLTVKSDGTIADKYVWSSSNQKIITVNENGTLTAWRKGTATITVKNNEGITDSIQITVDKNSVVSSPKNNTINLSGKSIYNASYNNYTVWSAPMTSFLSQNSDKTLTRVQLNNGSVLAENYTTNGNLISTKIIKNELKFFGGFYSGDNYNYLVFGQSNDKESKTAEVMRIVKYDKSWNRISAVSIKGANTYIPFSAGCLRMTETNGLLYVYTCHEMFKDSDGIHHQSNMTFVIKESNMTVSDKYYDVMNIAQAGYVSHSFNQFIQTDGKIVYRVDHGDASPRAISMTECTVGKDITKVGCIFPIDLSNITGYNDTGASIGGFELSSVNTLIAGNAVDYTKKNASSYGTRNIFVSSTKKNYTTSGNDISVKWLTNYSSKSNITVRTPQLVKISEDGFLLMWEEEIGNGNIYTRMVTIDDLGNKTSDIITSKMALSDCQPILCADGLVRWYTNNNNKTKLYAVNPYDLDSASVTVSLNKTSLVLEQGQTYKLKATLSDGSSETMNWSTSNSMIAAVSNGIVTARSTGTATITAKASNGKTALCKITVKPALKLSKTLISAGKGEKIHISSSIANVKWRTSNSKILIVDQSGNVKTVGTGTAWVTVRATDGREKSCKVTVKNAPSKIMLTKGIVTLHIGQSYTLGSYVNNGSACLKRTYRTSNKNAIKMIKTNWIAGFKAVKTGIAYVTVRTYNGKEASCKVKVIN